MTSQRDSSIMLVLFVLLWGIVLLQGLHVFYQASRCVFSSVEDISLSHSMHHRESRRRFEIYRRNPTDPPFDFKSSYSRKFMGLKSVIYLLFDRTSNLKADRGVKQSNLKARESLNFGFDVRKQGPVHLQSEFNAPAFQGQRNSEQLFRRCMMETFWTSMAESPQTQKKKKKKKKISWS